MSIIVAELPLGESLDPFLASVTQVASSTMIQTPAQDKQAALWSF